MSKKRISDSLDDETKKNMIDSLLSWYDPTPAKLSAELKRCIAPGPLGQMIAHKFVHEVFYAEIHHKHYNQRLKYKKKAAKEALKKKDYTTFIFLHERPYRMEALLEVSNKCGENKVFWQLARYVWEDSENIWQYLSEWEEIFRSNRPYSECFMTEEERKVFNELPVTFEIYRGYEHGVNEYGLSWTLSKEKAEWFSKRFISRKLNPSVKSRLVSKSECFAYLGGRNEQEIIIKPLELS